MRSEDIILNQLEESLHKASIVASLPRIEREVPFRSKPHIQQIFYDDPRIFWLDRTAVGTEIMGDGVGDQ